jgi:hypothetical protein
MLVALLLLLILIQATTGALPLSPQAHWLINALLLILGIFAFFYGSGFIVNGRLI